ncbi:MAG TPA: PxKF domain-containing protein [Candidatus Limnocylindrales bacterium]|jgi:hypothetical protein|nr:PxKF domain-containing protein [Candidatus Limnocylindrales bacterium]
MASRTLRRSLALAGAALLLSTSVVFADDISNALDADIDAIAEVMPLNVGGPIGTTDLYLQPRNGDGKNGCNIQGGQALVLSVASSDLAVATVTPGSVTFESCGDTPVLTIAPLSAGSTTISVSQTSNTTSGTFNLAPATFVVTVAPPPNTAPTVSIKGVTGGASYEIGADLPAVCSVEDAEDGDSTFAATLSAISGPLAAFGLGERTASCSYTDGGGLTASASVTFGIVDTGDPTIVLQSRTPAANADGWNNTDVTLVWSCSDTGSGVASATVAETVSTEGADRSATGTCEDNAGNTASDTQAGISIDKTAPSISDDGPAGDLGLNGWYVSPVVNTFTASDGLSGVAGTNPVSPSTGSAEGVGITVNSGPFSDLAGNTTAGIDSVAFNIDLSDPTDVAFSSLLSGSFIFGSVPPAPTCTATDAVSGLAGCVVTGYSTLVGTHTLIATASDNAGRTATATATYTVLPWTLSGFYSPVDIGGILNVVRGGATVPLKFEVFAGPTEMTSVSSIASFTTAAIDCGIQTGADEIEIASTGGTSLRYDTTAGQFIQNWQTPKTPGLCYRATMTTLDGSSLTAYFRTR